MVNIPKTTVIPGGWAKDSTKLYSLIFLTTVLSALAGLLLNSALLLYGLIALVAFLTLFILEVFFINQKKLLYIAVVFGVVAFGIPFYKLMSLYFVAALAVFLIFMLYSAYRGRHEIDNMIKIYFSRVVRVMTTLSIAGIVIFLSAVLILSSNFAIKEERVERMVNISAPLFERLVGEFTGNTQLRTILANFSIKNTAQGEAFRELPKVQQQILIDKSIVELKERLEKFLGVEIDLDVSISSNIHKIITIKLGSLASGPQLYWSIIGIAIIWVSIRSVEFLIFIPLAFLVFLMYELFFALGFASIQLESRSKEVISLQ